jgi:translation initiation factor IF-1
MKQERNILAKEATIEMEGTVQEVLPNTQFRVRLANGADVLAYAGGKMRQRRIRIIAGDRVNLEMSPYDVTRGRINYRHLDSPAPTVKRRFPFKRK